MYREMMYMKEMNVKEYIYLYIFRERERERSRRGDCVYSVATLVMVSRKCELDIHCFLFRYPTSMSDCNKIRTNGKSIRQDQSNNQSANQQEINKANHNRISYSSYTVNLYSYHMRIHYY